MFNVIFDYYSQMPIVWKMPTSQCNSAKMITVLNKLFAEHGIPEVIWSDNEPQLASHHFFAEFTKDWNIKHSTSSPRSNRQGESVVKIVKGLLTHAKDCTGSIPHFISIQEYPNWFSSTITYWGALSTYSMHNCALKDQALVRISMQQLNMKG